MGLGFSRSFADGVSKKCAAIFRDSIDSGGKVAGLNSGLQQLCDVWIWVGLLTAGHGHSYNTACARDLTTICIGGRAVAGPGANSYIFARALDLNLSVLAVLRAIGWVIAEKILCA